MDMYDLFYLLIFIEFLNVSGYSLSIEIHGFRFYEKAWKNSRSMNKEIFISLFVFHCYGFVFCFILFLFCFFFNDITIIKRNLRNVPSIVNFGIYGIVWRFHSSTSFSTWSSWEHFRTGSLSRGININLKKKSFILFCFLCFGCLLFFVFVFYCFCFVCFFFLGWFVYLFIYFAVSFYILWGWLMNKAY